MVDQDIVDYIKEFREKDFTDEEIRESLEGQDISKSTINSAFEALGKKSKKGTPKPSSPDPFDLGHKGIFLGAFAVCLIIGLYVLKNAGLGSGFLLTPFSTILTIVRSETSINIPLLIIATALLASAFFSIAYYAIKRYRDDFIIYAVAPLSFLCVLILYGWSTLSFFAAIGLAVALVTFIRNIEDKKYHYKVIDFKEITVMTFRHALLIFSFILGVGVYLSLLGSSDFAEIEINNFLASAGLSLEEGDDLKEQIVTQQRNAQEDMLESIGLAMAQSIQADSDIPDSCKLRVTEKLDSINANAKDILNDRFESIDFESDLPNGANQRLNQMQKMISGLKKQYPLMTALTVFMLIELLRKGIAFILLIECYLITFIQQQGKRDKE